MTPTLSDFRKEERLALESRQRGAFTEPEYQAVLRAINNGRATRSNRASIHGRRMEYDLNVIKRMERELDEISGPMQRAGEAGSHLVRREVRLQARMDDDEEPPTEPVEMSPRAVNRRQPTNVEMRRMLLPLGMQLSDEDARPITAWRLHERDLLDGRAIPDVLAGLLASHWEQYRQHFPENAPFGNGNGNVLMTQGGIDAYIRTDEGARFRRVRDIIR